ncbi:MAG: 50S ribosomal protein L24 [Clostridiales bacterium]|nr:50S ribosomal protein L24 [Clostridiales bacterium]
MSLNVKKGDTVLVIAGKDKGKSGKVLVAQPADNSVVVAGVNMISKHKKPRSAKDKGGIIKKEGKIDASNVQIICPACNKATRINHETVDGKKIRQCKKCGANLDTATKKETKKATTKTTETKKATAAKSTTKTTAKATEAKSATKTTAKTTEAKETKTTTKAPAAKKSETAEKKTTTKSTASKPAAKTTATKSTTKTTSAAKSTTTKKTTTKKVESK